MLEKNFFDIRLKRARFALAFLVFFCAFVQMTLAFAHTNRLGYVFNPDGSVAIWWATYHTGSTTEGDTQLTGPVSGTQANVLTSATLPAGFVNLIQTTGGPFGSCNMGPNLSWQGATFTGLTAGTYLANIINV